MNKSIDELRAKNNDLHKQLTKEHDAILTDIVVYLRTCNINNMQMEEIRQDLLDMVISAQNRNEPISNVIGNDYKEFCDEIVRNAIPKSIRERIFEDLSIIAKGGATLLTINIILSGFLWDLIRNLIDEKTVNLNYSFTLGFLFSTLIILIVSYLIVMFIGKKTFKFTELSREQKTKPKRKTYLKRFLWGGIFGLLFMVMVICSRILNKHVLFKVNIFLLFGIILLLLIVDRTATRMINRGHS